jgi:hypothetical protein
MPHARIRRLLPLLALASLAAACDPSTAPEASTPFDTDAALADYEAVVGLIASSDLAALRALGGRTPFSSTSGGTAAASGDAGATTTEVEPFAAPLISETHRGSTFAYVPDEDRYVLDPERTGAPSTGVRFVLYDVDAAGAPIIDEEIGHADLIDEGDGSAEDVVLHLLVVTHGATVLDYRTTVNVGLTWAEVGVLGFLQGANDVRLDFNVGVDATRSLSHSALDVAFDLAVESRDLAISGSVSGVEGGVEGEGNVLVTVRHGSHTLDMDVTGAGGELDGTVMLNGELFATVTGNAQSPTIVSADGDPLTFGEQLVLLRVLDTVEDVFDFLEDLMEPAGELVGLGIILS